MLIGSWLRCGGTMEVIHMIGTDIAPIVQAVTSFAGVIGLFLVWYQIKATNEWNRANAQHDLLSNLPSWELETRVWQILEPLERDEHWHLNEIACPKIYENISDWVAVKTYLNKHEELCAAIGSNAVSERYAYNMHGAKIADTFGTFENYIAYLRKKSGDSSIYLELEKVATKWKELAHQEQDDVRRKLEQMRDQRGATKKLN